MRVLMRKVLVICLVATTLWAGWAQAQDVYRVGVVPQYSQRTLHTTWRPILDELERRTGLRFKLTGSPRIPAFEVELMAGNFDFVYMNPYHIIKGHDGQGYLPLVRDGARRLSGILVVDIDSPIKRAQDLEGKTLAFPSPNALGASLLLQAELKQKYGIQFTAKYVQTHSSVYLHVARHLVDAGGGVISTLLSQPKELQDRLKVIYETEKVHPHPFAAHPRIPLEVREKVRQTMLAMGRDIKLHSLFRSIPILGIESANMDDYDPLRKLNLDDVYTH